MSRYMYLAIAVPVFAISGASVFAGPGIPDEPPAAVATGDINRDGIADLVMVTPAEGNGSGKHLLTVMLGQADGAFRTVASQNAIPSKARALVIGDFNGDGNADVVVAGEDGVLLEFLGNGSGKMTQGPRIATFGAVASLAVGHFTHSPHLDLVVSDPSSNSGDILLGVGDGSFRQAWSFPLPRTGTEFQIATADFNKDGVADLVITSDDENNYEVMVGNGNGTFTYSPELSHLRDPNTYCPT